MELKITKNPIGNKQPTYRFAWVREQEQKFRNVCPKKKLPYSLAEEEKSHNLGKKAHIHNVFFFQNLNFSLIKKGKPYTP